MGIIEKDYRKVNFDGSRELQRVFVVKNNYNSVLDYILRKRKQMEPQNKSLFGALNYGL